MAPYRGMGHHSPITRALGRRLGLPQGVIDCRFNVLNPNGINKGRFYELHFRVDLRFAGTRLPSSAGGSWSGREIGLSKYGVLGRIWHGTPAITRLSSGGMFLSTIGAIWYFGSDSETGQADE